MVVWSGHTFEKLKTILGHQSHVKGLAFDPANKYFATASDDRTIKIWRFNSPGPNSSAHDQMNNFVLEKTISSPFTASPLTTYFRRCSWSPDGNHVAAANAVNGPVSSVAIVNRGSWDGDIHLIGHEGPVEVCAFSPRLFSQQPLSAIPRDAKGHLISSMNSVIACAGQDKALSIWITTNPRPLIITQDLTVKSISDLAWTPDGKSLFLTSLDGSILAVLFQHGELGFEISLEDNERSLAKFGAGRKGAGILEGTAGLLLEEQSKEGEIRGVEGRMGALMGDATSSQGPATNGAGAVLVNGSGTTDVPNGHSASQSLEVGAHQATKPPTITDPNTEKLERLKQRVSITKDGKKRIAPLLVSSSGGQESSLPHSQVMASASKAQGTINDAQTTLDLSKPFDGLPRGGLAALLLGNKRRLATVEGDDDGQVEKRLALASKNGATPLVSSTVDGLVPARATAAPVGQQPTPEFLRPAVTNPSLSTSQVRLSVPKVRSHIVQSVDGEVTALLAPQANGTGETNTAGSGIAQGDLVIEARNPSHLSVTGRPQDHDPCRVTVTKRGQPIWQDYLPKSALLVTGNKRFWSVACEDGSIYVWTPAGRRLINAMVLESQPVIFDCKEQWLLCVTAVGMCYVFDIPNGTSPHPPISLAPILDAAVQSLTSHTTRAPAVSIARINSEGRIIVALTNGHGYAYSPSMYVWQRLSEPWWAGGSQYWNSADSSVGNLRSGQISGAAGSILSSGIIPLLERYTTSATSARGRAYDLTRLVKQLFSREGFEGFESNVSVAHLENRVAAALMLGAKQEFRMYLSMYARALASEGLKTKAQELLCELHGGIHDGDLDADTANGTPPRNNSDRRWGSLTGEICGWPRTELLRDVILLLGECSCAGPERSSLMENRQNP